MQTQGFPLCCTSTVLTGLGSTLNQDWGARTGNNMGLFEMNERLRHLMSFQTRYAMMQAVATDQQKDFIKVARANGWRFGPWAASLAHKNTKTRLCYWLVQDGIVHSETVRNKLGLTA